MVYQLVNPDDHDRILTDPAYRLSKTQSTHSRIHTYLQTLSEIESQFLLQNGDLTRYPMNKLDYQTMIEVEKSVMKMDRHFDKVMKVLKIWILVQ